MAYFELKASSSQFSGPRKVPHSARLLLRASKAFALETTWLRAFYRRMRFLAQSIRVRRRLRDMLAAPLESALGRLIHDRPQTLGVVSWPFQCLGWNASERLNLIQEHCSIVDALGYPLAFPTDDKVILASLGKYHEEISIVLDQADYFFREGQLTFSIFYRRYRAFSLVFTLQRRDGDIEAVIGAIQGRRSEDALRCYREITNRFHGMRPRHLLIEVFRIFCRSTHINRILAVTDASRIHHSSYFGGARNDQMLTRYNEIWEDRGGYLVSDVFYELPVQAPLRNLADVEASSRVKRKYRRRQEILDDIESEMTVSISNSPAVKFAAS